MSPPIYPSLRVLVVDDIRAMRLVIRSLLRSCGVEHITEAGDGGEALDVLRARPIDLVISDLFMKPVNGLQMMNTLRKPKSSLNPTVPVLMISGNMDGPSVTAAIAAGVNEFLGKPITALAFRQRMNAMLEKPRPVIKTPSYWGPERRRRPFWVRHDRRASVNSSTAEAALL